MSEFTNIYQVWESSGQTISPGARGGKDEPFLKFFSKIKKNIFKNGFQTGMLMWQMSIFLPFPHSQGWFGAGSGSGLGLGQGWDRVTIGLELGQMEERLGLRSYIKS